MIREIIAQLKKREKEIAEALTSRFLAAIHRSMPAVFAVANARTLIVVSESGNVLDMGKRYRLTSGHAPIFSLYTFFGKR
jgi:hypothetical protein